jgi:hypothetical protein
MEYTKTFCSQCGRDFGPGDHGFSECKRHRRTSYHILLSADLGEVVSQVGEVLKNLNSLLAKDGMREQLSVRSKIIRCTLTTSHELDRKEREQVKKVIVDQFNESVSAWKVSIESFRRQSGNVQQLVESAS